MDYSFWQKQTIEKPLFPDIEWSKPERRDQAGKLAIIGGNKLGFLGVGEAYLVAQEAGVGQVRVLLPDALKKSIPPTMTDVVFGASNPSGGLSKPAAPEMKAIGQWSDNVLLIGDAGRNSETAIVYEDFVQSFSGQLTISRDAIELFSNNSLQIIDRENTLIVASFAQLQKIFQAIYYPKMLTFSMQLTQLVETLHKFTLSYPSTILVLHQDTIVVASDGKVITTPWNDAMAIWRGRVAAKAASYQVWNPKSPIEPVVASLLI